MKKLFDKVGKKRDTNTLVGKVVLVGQFSVKVEALIGEGGFATIYRCVDLKSGHTFALKHLRLGADAEAIKEVQQEAKTMARLKGHPNILKLHAVAFAGPKGGETDGFMLLDFCPLTLLEVMQRANFLLDDYLVYEVFQDVVLAVAHMHKCNPPLAHRDLKAENVLKNSEGRWVICDFGSSTARAQVYDTQAEIAVEEENIRRTTTPAYRAPEMWDLYSRQRIDTAVDVWALGVLLYVLSFGKLPFQGDSKLSILYGKYDMPPGRPAAMRSLIQDMLQVNPKDRPDVFQVISKLDVLRNALSGDLAGGSPQSAAPPPPQALLPPPPQALVPGPHAQPHPHAHPRPHPQHPHPQQAPAALPGSAVGPGAPLPYSSQQPPNAPANHALGGAPQGPYPGGHGAGPPPQLQRPQAPPVNSQSSGPPGPWPSGSPPYSHSLHVPAHMQPQLHAHPHAGAPLQPPQPHQPHPSPYPAAPHGAPPQQQLYPQLPQQLQPQPPGPGGQGPGAPHPGAGQGPTAATGQPRPAAPVAPPVLRMPSRLGNFSPSWPAASPAAAAAGQPAQPGGAAPEPPVVPQLADLMDAEPVVVQSAAAAMPVADGGLLGASWERDMQGGPYNRPVEALAGLVPFPAAYSPSLQINQDRCTGSLTELTRSAAANQVATVAVAAASSHAFGDDVDWGEQPAFISSSSQLPSQQFEASDLVWMDSLATAAPSSATATVNAAAPTAAGTIPLAPQPAAFPNTSICSLTSQASAPAGPSPAAPPLAPGAMRTASAVPVAMAAAPVTPREEVADVSSGAVPRSASAPEAAAAVAAPASGAAAAAASAVAVAGAVTAQFPAPSAPVVAGGSEEVVDGLRVQVQRLTTVNGQLEGRVRQLEGVVASQGAMIQRLASELHALTQWHQQQQQPVQGVQKPQQQQQETAAPALSQQQQQHQTDGGLGGAVNVAGGMQWAPGTEPSAGSTVAGSIADHAVGGGGGTGAAGGGGPGSTARANSAAAMGFDLDPWGSLAEPSPPLGVAIYPPLRYEDLA